MQCIKSLSILLLFTLRATAQTPTTVPSSVDGLNSTAPSETATSDPLLGKLFRSRVDGIQLNPPNGGTMIRALDASEIVRFVYTASNWDLRVKPMLLGKPAPLSSPKLGTGVLEMMTSQLQEENPTAVVLIQKVQAAPSADEPERKIGRIEARYKAGTDVIFAQEAIIVDQYQNSQHYFMLQMNSPSQAKAPGDKTVDVKETEARNMFEHVLASVTVLDRKKLREEQEKRIWMTTMLWVQLDRKRIEQALQPVHFMRVVRDGKDIGFIQVDERNSTHNGHEGIEYIVHSRVETGADQATDAARPKASEAVAETADLSAPTATNIVVPNGMVAANAPTALAKAANLYTQSTYFVSYGRRHEDWVSVTQVDQQADNQLTEMGNSDLIDKLVLDAQKMKEEMKSSEQPGVKQLKPEMKKVADGALDVSLYNHNRPLGKPVNVPLPPYYLPQALGQLLPRVLPTDPAQYLFATYVSNEKQLMARYVEVGLPADFVLDGKPIHAIPISDRIGVEGNPTIHYVTREGQWLGSVNELSKLLVMPSDENTLASIWKNDARGFKVCPLPPPAADDSTGSKSDEPERKLPAKLKPSDRLGR